MHQPSDHLGNVLALLPTTFTHRFPVGPCDSHRNGEGAGDTVWIGGRSGVERLSVAEFRRRFPSR